MNLNRLFSIMLESTKRASLRKKLTKFCLTTAIITTFTATAVSAQNSFAEIEPLEFSSQDLGFPPNIEYEDLGKPKNTKYWQAGERIENILQLKDFDETGLPSLSLFSILENSSTPIDDLSLADFSLLKKTKFKKLVNAVPSLKSFRLNEVEPLYDLVKKGVGSGKAKSLANTKISSVIKDNNIANLSLNKINLNNYSLDSIPQLINSPLNAFPHWGNQFLSEIPGLVEMPFESLFNFLSAGIPVAKVDLILNSAEGYIDNTITGSYQAGFNVNCNQSNCPHIELTTYLPMFSGYDGKRWIGGNAQQVIGGSGCLVGIEPTGRHPFGDSFKIVLTGVDEAQSRAYFSMFFRFCLNCGCTPYIIGPIPFFTLSEKDPLFLGF